VRRLSVLIVVLVVACKARSVETTTSSSSSNAPPANVAKGQDLTTIVGAAQRAAAGDLDGDGVPELVLCDAQELRVVKLDGTSIAKVPVRGGVQVLNVADLDGDGRAEILAGFGQTGFRREVTGLRMSIFRLDGGQLVEELVAAPATTRADVQAMLPAPEVKGMLVAWFDSKYMVKSALATRDASGVWTLTEKSTIRMATSYGWGDVDGDHKPDLVIGRMYGDHDDVKADGDAFVWHDDGTQTPIPITKGVRSLVLADSDGDGVDEIYLGDGWDRAYKAKGRGLLTWAQHGANGFTSAIIEDTPGQWAIMSLAAADLDGDGRPEIIGNGSDYVRVWKRTGATWTGVTIGKAARDVAVVQGKTGPAKLLLVGEGDVGGTGGTSRLVEDISFAGTR
jgi:hypothetical protein